MSMAFVARTRSIRVFRAVAACRFTLAGQRITKGRRRLARTADSLIRAAESIERSQPRLPDPIAIALRGYARKIQDLLANANSMFQPPPATFATDMEAIAATFLNPQSPTAYHRLIDNSEAFTPDGKPTAEYHLPPQGRLYLLNRAVGAMEGINRTVVAAVGVLGLAAAIYLVVTHRLTLTDLARQAR